MRQFLPLFSLIVLQISVVLSRAELIISEVQAANKQTLSDSDGDSPDWVEIYNSGPGSADLEGHFLSDDAADLSKWAFPAVTLSEGGFLIVYASGKDRTSDAADLHTDFQLSSGGEYLALVAPDGETVVHEFSPAFSAMQDDESYGVPFDGTTYLDEGAEADVLVPTSGSLGSVWNSRNYSPNAAWDSMNTGVGFGDVSGPALDGLVAYYDFEEGTGTQLLDKSGNNHHGTLTQMNATSDWVSSKNGLGLALDFDGSNDRVTLKGASSLGLTGDFTVTAWVRLDNTNGDNTILGQDANGLHLTTRSNKAYFGFWGNDTNGGSHTVSPSQWTHLTWRFDGGEQALFVNGEFDNATGGHAALGDTSTVYLGRSKGNQGWFDGRMDEVAIFDRVLTNDEIAEIASGTTLSPGGGDLETAMLGRNGSAYVRVPFAISSLSGIDSLTLQMQYNDGFVAYLNGMEVARRNAPASLSWNSTATASRSKAESEVWETINLSEHKDLLVVGSNVLAIQGLNASANDDSFLINPILSAGGLLTGTPGIFNEPTPGRANTAVSSLGQVADTKFSVDRGFYDASFQVAITTATSGALIRYTTDGSTPSPTSGTLYGGPITISKTTPLRAIAYKNGFTPSKPDTQTYIFINDVVNQTSTPPSGWPTGTVNGQVLDYGMDRPSDIGTTTTGLKEALMAIDSVSIVTDVANLFSTSTGIYVHAGNRGRAWERESSFELLPANGEEGVQSNAGLRIRGGFSRSGNNPKHAFRLFFRNDYDGDLKYPLFGNEGVDRFKNIDFRTAQNYSWSFQGGTRNSFVREVFARDSQRDMGRPHTRSRYYHLYLNGVYWGLFMTQERAEASFGESYFGGDSDEYDAVKSTGSPGGYQIEATDGEMTGWTAFWELANQLAASSNVTTRRNLYQRLQGLNPDGTRNASYPVYLDVDNLIDYMLVILFVGSYDAPVSNFLGNDRPNNWFSLWNRNGHFGFQYFAHDCEHSLGTGSGSTITNRNGPWPAGQTLNYSNPQWIHQQLMALDDYRLRFGDRAHDVFFNDGLLTPGKTIARIDARAAMIDQAIHAESARWGDAKGTVRTRSTWLNELNNIRGYLSSRTNVVVEQLKNTRRYNGGNSGSGTTSAPLYPSVDAPRFNQHGGQVPANFGLRFTAGSGSVYYTLDGSDPRLPNGAVSGSAQLAQEGSVSSQTLYSTNSGIKALVPTNGNLGTTWRNVSFNDNSWLSGNGGVGYDENSDYDSLIDLDVDGPMNNNNTSIYVRSKFTVSSPQTFQGLTLRMKFEDGFVAFLNGQQVASFNAPGTLSWDSEGTALHDDATAQTFVDFDITGHLDKLIAGTNVLAIHGLNDNLGSSDFLILPELVGTRVSGGSAITLPNAYTEVKARALDGGEWSALNSAAFLLGTTAPTSSNVIISEIMYHPGDPTAAEIAAGFTDADHFEYIELMNIGDQPVDLTGVQFIDGITFQFGSGAHAVLGAGERVLLVRNRAAFEFRYGTDHAVAGEYSGGLANGGEMLVMADAAGNTLKSVAFDDDEYWPALADGLGSSLVIINPDGNPDPALPASWTASSEGGSPGAGDGEDIPAILVNEALTHTDWPQVDAVELFNPTDAPVNVSGWFLTDDPRTPSKFAIPTGSVVPAGGYLVILEDNDADPNNNASLPPAFFGRVFSLSSAGDEIYLYSADGNGLTGYRHGFSFDGAANGVSFGRLTNSNGDDRFPAVAEPTLGSANALPVAPDVIISEVMYNPGDPAAPEFIEIWNRSTNVVPLYDEAHPENTWRLGGVDFDFPPNQTLQPGEVLLVVEGEPADFRALHEFHHEIKVMGRIAGSLDNGGERLKLLRPDEPTTKNGETVVPMIVVDAVEYDDADPWPADADGLGKSLERLNPDDFGDDPASWVVSSADGGSPGRIPGRLIVSVSSQGQGTVTLAPNKTEFDSGENVSLTPVAAPGWAFVRWEGAASGSAVPLQITVTESVSVQAVFEQQASLTIQTETTGQGTISVTPNQPAYLPNAVVQVSATAAPGYRFAGWEGSLTGTTNPASLTLSESANVRAVFIRQWSVQVSANGSGQISISPDKPVYDDGDRITLTAAANTGARFAGWSGGASGNATSIEIVVNAALNVTGNFIAQRALTVNVTGQGGVTRSPNANSYDDGTQVTLTAVPQPGWTFMGWSGSHEGAANPLEITLMQDTTINALFQRFVSLTPSVQGEGTIAVSPNAPTYLAGAQVTLTANPAEGYRFAGWSGDATGAANPLTVTLSANSEITASFVALGSLATVTEGTGTITRSPDKPSYDEGEQVTLTAVSAPGWQFTHWSGALDGTANPQSLTIAGTQTVTAHFKRLYALEVFTTGEGSVTANPQRAAHLEGTQVTLTATPTAGYEFLHWDDDGGGSNANSFTLTMDSAKRLTAVFGEIVTDPYEDWLETQFEPSELNDPTISGPNADPDGDRLSNFLEFVLKRNAIQSESGSGIDLVRGGDGALFFLVEINEEALEDLAFRLEVSTDLKTWRYNGDGSGITYLTTTPAAPQPSGRVRFRWRLNTGWLDGTEPVAVRFQAARN